MPGLAAAFERIGAFLELRLPLTHAAGAALAVTDRDEVLGVVVRGFADAAAGAAVRPQTRFQIGSISKSFAAIVALQEAEAGRLDLRASVNELLPWAEIPEPFGPITPHHLLSHTSGLVQGTEESPGALGSVRRLRDLAPGFAPGERFWYSNDGYKLLGLILERTTGVAIHELLRDRILDPLDMTSSAAAITNETRLDLATGYAPVHDDRPPQLTHPLVPAPWIVSNSADGSIVSDVLDMSAYARLLLRSGEGVLSAEAFERLTTPAIEDASTPGFGYAYGLWVGEEAGRRTIRHSGGMIGYTALLAVEPEEGLGCVMLLNGAGDRSDTVAFALACVRAALEGSSLPEVLEPADPAAIPAADAYAGRYRGDDRVVEIVGSGPGLELREGDASARLLPAGPDSFLLADPAFDRYLLRFGREASGSVVEAFHGGSWLVREGADVAPAGPTPVAWEGYPGLYRSNDPWLPVIRILLRKGELVREVTGDWEDVPHDVLVPIDGGWFRVGVEPWRPDRVRFEDVVDGIATAVRLDGGTWYRSFEP